MVLEIEGPAWRQVIDRVRTNAARRAAAAATNPDSQEFARQAQAGREGLALEEGQASRLFAIDAGALRALPGPWVLPDPAWHRSAERAR